ncbi:hypothetical protein [Pseudomonas rhodesiae]|jgi:hypothetical protein|uniref:hypothetical protein n=1 Tax=Pseudomonas rhodesiae TaxID=76760 RepID=UPI001F3325C6|nr:hypothetical protein [Pseudomonas rhodesiae]
MSDKGKAAWLGLWLWVASGVFLICTTFGLVLFGMYGSYFPKVSGVRDDWNVFGALLGGFGSCVGAIATLATLLFLAHQNRKQQDFIDWQVKTQTFEQFLNHRRVFTERIEEIQSRYDHKIRFPEVETLYLGLFPDNGPTHLDLKAFPKSAETYENLLWSLGAQFERLDVLMRKTEWSDGEAYSLATQLFEMVSDLGFEWIGEPSDGDVIRGGVNTGINIYSLHEALIRMKLVYNAYLRFTGNPTFDGLNHGVSRFVSEALMKCRRLRRFVVYTSVSGLSELQDLYFEIGTFRDASKNWLLPETYRLLESTFESRQDVAQLNDADHYMYILGTAINEISNVLLTVDEGDEIHARLTACRQSLFDIFSEIRHRVT